MALSEQEEELLEAVLMATADSNKLRNWDQTFISDVRGRFEEHGPAIRLSYKQWDNIKRIGAARGVPGCDGD